LKYRHAFHAGNFADVHKHTTLIACLAAMVRKDKGFLYVETHAGAGVYDLHGPAARQGDESEAGVGRIMNAQAAPPFASYCALIEQCRRETGLRQAYPGSPWLAGALLRSQDRAVLHEIDAADHAALARSMHSLARVRTEQADGYQALRALLPPVERRGLVLIDPPYEDADADRTAIVASLTDALRRFATGVYVVWYPLKLAAERDRWLRHLVSVCRHAEPHAREWLSSEFWVHALDSRVSLAGSGMFIVNPPFQLAGTLQTLNESLHSILGGPHGGHCITDRL
jgi:23S rRNA (adenine2030-N6)-methyltransferase